MAPTETRDVMGKVLEAMLKSARVLAPLRISKVKCDIAKALASGEVRSLWNFGGLD